MRRELLIEKYTQPVIHVIHTEHENTEFKIFLWRNKYGLRHRYNNLPAIITIRDNKLESAYFYKNGIEYLRKF